MHLSKPTLKASGSIALVLLLLIGVASVASAYTVIKTMGIGNGRSDVGLEGIDSDILGPEAIAVSRDGQVHVLDTVNNRVIGTTQSEIKIKLGAHRARDLVAVGNELYILADRPIHIVPPESPSGLASIGGVASYASAAFSQFGSNASPAGPGGGLASISPPRSIFTSAGRAVKVKIKRTSPSKAELTVDSSIQLVVEGSGQLGNISLLDVDADGHYFVKEDVRENASSELQVEASVLRFSSAGKQEHDCRLPLDEVDFLPTRFVAIAPDGRILFLSVKKSIATVIEIDCDRKQSTGASSESMSPDRSNSEEPQVPNPPGGGLASVASATECKPEVLKSVSRTQILEEAERFGLFSWTLAPSNYRGSERSLCNPPTERWRRPPRLEDMENRSIEGLPYTWGGKDSIACFDEKIEKGWVAGNVCTCLDCVRPGSTGVDCSGFVSQAWRVAPTGNGRTCRFGEADPP